MISNNFPIIDSSLYEQNFYCQSDFNNTLFDIRGDEYYYIVKIYEESPNKIHTIIYDFINDKYILKNEFIPNKTNSPIYGYLILK